MCAHKGVEAGHSISHVGLHAARTSVRVLAKHHHLALVTFTGQVTLEAILVPTLLFTHLTVPA